MIDLSLYLVTNRQGLEIEHFLKTVRAAVEGGVKIVQLREKDISAREMVSVGKKLLSLLRPLGIPLIINDRADIAHAIGADGVHLGQQDIRVSEARALLGSEAIIGLSVSSFDQMKAACAEDVNYLAIGPVFHTKTKSDCAAPCGLNGLRELCATSHCPIVAIGGINDANARQIFECGASGVAVVSAIFNAPCPKTAAEVLCKCIKR